MPNSVDRKAGAVSINRVDKIRKTDILILTLGGRQRISVTQRAIDGPYIYFVTTVVTQRRQFFVTSRRAEHLRQIIVTACQMKHFELLGYCILPDHLHLLVRNINTKLRALEKARHENQVPSLHHKSRTSRRRLSSDPWRGLSSPRRYSLSDLMQSIKGNFSWHLDLGQFWQSRSMFKIIENEKYLSNVLSYIQNNYHKLDLDEDYGKVPFVFIDWGAVRDLV